MIHRPVCKNGAAINILARDGTEDTRIIGTNAVVAEDEEAVLGHAHGTEVATILILRRHVRLWDGLPVHVQSALADFDGFTRLGGNAAPIDAKT